MGRARRKPLPRGVHERRHRSGRLTYSIDFVDHLGERRQEAAGGTIDEAMRLLAARRAEVAAGTYAPGERTGAQTLATYARSFLEARRSDGVRTADREAQILRDHVLPVLGRIALVDLRPKVIAAWVRKLEGAPKSRLNAHGVLSSLLARARFEELIPDNPAKGLPRGVLPRNVRVREVGAWTRDEAEILITCDAIPEDRRVAYAIASYTAARVGEIAGCRFAHLDTKAAPLWRWALRTQYDGEPLKTDNPRDVPIHPELQRILADWRANGWVRMMRRHPTPDDLVIPRETAISIEREDGSIASSWVHSKESLGAKAVHRHAKLAGLSSGGRDFHSFRRTMITCARVDGVREELLERITHNAAGDQIDGYTYFGWDVLCAELAKLAISARRGAAVVRLAATAQRDAARDADTNAPEILSDLGGVLMEAPGVEVRAPADPGRIVAVPRGGGGKGRSPKRPADPHDADRIPGRVTRVTPAARIPKAEIEQLARRAASRLDDLGEHELAAAVAELLARLRG